MKYLKKWQYCTVSPFPNINKVICHTGCPCPGNDKACRRSCEQRPSASCWSLPAPMAPLQGTARSLSDAGDTSVKVYSRQNMAHRQGRKLRSSSTSTKARGGGKEVLQARHPCSLWRKRAGESGYLLKDLGRTHAGAGEKCEEEKSAERGYQGLTTCPLSRSL